MWRPISRKNKLGIEKTKFQDVEWLDIDKAKTLHNSGRTIDLQILEKTPINDNVKIQGG